MTEPNHPHIFATLLRDRVLAADGTPYLEVDDAPGTWRDGGETELVSMGRGVFIVVAPDDSATLTQIEDRATAMAVRATFAPQAPCPLPRMGDLLAVELGSAAMTFEVRLTGWDMTSVAPGWTPMVDSDLAPGELLLELREDVGLTFGGGARAS